MNFGISLKAVINSLIALKFILLNIFQGSEKLHQSKKYEVYKSILYNVQETTAL